MVFLLFNPPGLQGHFQISYHLFTMGTLIVWSQYLVFLVLINWWIGYKKNHEAFLPQFEAFNTLVKPKSNPVSH